MACPGDHVLYRNNIYQDWYYLERACGKIESKSLCLVKDLSPFGFYFILIQGPCRMLWLNRCPKLSQLASLLLWLKATWGRGRIYPSYRLQCFKEGKTGQGLKEGDCAETGGTLLPGLLSDSRGGISHVTQFHLPRFGPSTITQQPRRHPTDTPTGISSVEVAPFQVYQVDK